MKRERILILIDDSGTCDKIGIIMEKNSTRNKTIIKKENRIPTQNECINLL